MKLSARRGLECRILHHLSQTLGHKGRRAWCDGPHQFACYFSIFSCYFKIYWHPCKILIDYGINGAKSCILGLSWHLISLLKLYFFVLFFSYFQQLFKIKKTFFLLLIILWQWFRHFNLLTTIKILFLQCNLTTGNADTIYNIRNRNKMTDRKYHKFAESKGNWQQS
jgi:predicted membrane protein